MVVDACALVDLLLDLPRASAIAQDLANADTLVAPGLIDVEVLSAVARMVRAGVINQARADSAIVDLVAFPMDRVAEADLTEGAWALRDRVAIADAFYVTLARTLNMELVTVDGRLARAPLPGVRIVLAQ